MHELLTISLLIIAFFVTGCIGGLLTGLFGLGGGVFYIPVFLTLFGIYNPGSSENMHVAIATSLALIVPGSAIAVQHQAKMGNVSLPIVIKWNIFVFIGALIGAIIISYLTASFLQVFFNIFIYFCLVLLWLRKEGANKTIKEISNLILGTYAFIVGAVSVLLGVGGGTLAVPFFKLFNYPYKRAVAISSTSGVIIGLTGTTLMVISGWNRPDLPAFSLGYINWLAFICVLPTTMIFAVVGAKLVNKLREEVTKYVYSITLLCIAIYMTLKITQVISW